jgi:hypothetical protein
VIELTEILGYSTRAVKSPMATAGAHARVIGGRHSRYDKDETRPTKEKKFVPLSVFFSNMEGSESESEMYGYKSKKDEKKPKKDPKTAREKNAAPSKSASANGHGSVAGGDKTVDKSMQSEGITTTGNVATTPVPIGEPLRRWPQPKKRKKKRKKKERKDWIEAMIGS